MTIYVYKPKLFFFRANSMLVGVASLPTRGAKPWEIPSENDLLSPPDSEWQSESVVVSAFSCLKKTTGSCLLSRVATGWLSEEKLEI